MKEQLELIKQNALAALDAADTPAALEELRVKLLGKKGELTAVLKQMGKLSPEERPVMGQLANTVRADIEAKLEERKASIHAAVLEAKLASEAIDVTIPGEAVAVGHQHPMNQVLQQIKDIFVGLGYQVVDGPEVELASYNFTRLNIEEGHPSRDRSDTSTLTTMMKCCCVPKPAQCRSVTWRITSPRCACWHPAVFSVRTKLMPHTLPCSIRSRALSWARILPWAT